MASVYRREWHRVQCGTFPLLFFVEAKSLQETEADWWLDFCPIAHVGHVYALREAVRGLPLASGGNFGKAEGYLLSEERFNEISEVEVLQKDNMRKISTIFERDWDGNRAVIDRYAVDTGLFDGATATEKLDGANVRLTVRNHTLVRLEKRRNPDKIQKAKGIEEPWYVDADQFAPADKHLWDAARNTDLSSVPDGEWSGEALGPNVQGNPLNLDSNRVVLFSCGEAPVFDNVPTTYEGLKEWLPQQKSKYGRDCGIEGIVWHCADGSMLKIKTKDFKPARR